MSLIFDVKRFAINDGPGIRTTFFFKGCPLSCKWCHNPESISSQIQKLYTKSKCIGAVKCIEVCPNDALTLSRNGILTDFNKCKLCGLCAEVCPTQALEMSGHEKTMDEILEIAEGEVAFYEQSGGGVTFSGGEPLMHSAYLLPLLTELGKRNIHRTIDTSGFASENIISEINKNTDLFLYDLKHTDDELHKKFTGQSNEPIISNLRFLSKENAEIIIRIPIIGGFNADDETINSMAKLIAKLEGKPKMVNLLAYHSIAKMKYAKLGEKYEWDDLYTPTDNELDNYVSIFSSYGIEASIGG